VDAAHFIIISIIICQVLLLESCSRFPLVLEDEFGHALFGGIQLDLTVFGFAELEVEVVNFDVASEFDAGDGDLAVRHDPLVGVNVALALEAEADVGSQVVELSREHVFLAGERDQVGVVFLGQVGVVLVDEFVDFELPQLGAVAQFG